MKLKTGKSHWRNKNFRWFEETESTPSNLFKETNLQRNNDTIPSAIRCLMMFPLNALVEDQKTRLRKYFAKRMVKDFRN